MYGLDLFSGIGGITKALDGYVQPVAYCENDRYATGVLLSRMADESIPVAPVWDDVTTLRGSMLPPIDIVYGGFPCQDLSVAGRGVGLAGKRSGLFSEIIRLAGEIRPRFVFLENVPAIRTRGGDVVAGELARLGYDARWTTLSAASVGANHRRERWWLLAHAKRQPIRDDGPGSSFRKAGEVQGGEKERERIRAHAIERCSDVADAERSERRPDTQGRDEPNGNDAGREEAAGRSRERREDVADAKGGRCRQEHPNPGGTSQGTIATKERRGPSNSGWWEVEPPLGRLVDGLPFRVDMLRALGNSVVPAQAREAFERLMGL